ncbi:hypothetical protein D3C81_1668900 [compost metagenome]
MQLNPVTAYRQTTDRASKELYPAMLDIPLKEGQGFAHNTLYIQAFMPWLGLAGMFANPLYHIARPSGIAGHPGNCHARFMCVGTVQPTLGRFGIGYDGSQ